MDVVVLKLFSVLNRPSYLCDLFSLSLHRLDYKLQIRDGALKSQSFL